jgi:Chaperone of endosialidase
MSADMADNKTTRLQLPLPNVDNLLEQDVVRLATALEMLDTLVAVLDANGKLIGAQLPGNVVLVDEEGKIPAERLPSIAINESFPVDSEADMLGLTADIGDVAIVSNVNKTFILAALPPSIRENWKELLSTDVTSVNGRTGNVTVAEAGANSDITSLNALSGPLRLGGDAASPYDAVTLRQLQASSGGGGATMNGVMNNHIGAVQWFNGSRAKLPAGYIAADGQLVSRTDAATADLWAAVNSGMLVSTTDALWLNDGSSLVATNRGKYSLGDGSTTFRLPDLNGAQNGSFGAPFLRGDQAGNTNVGGAPGTMQANGAPNITGSVDIRPLSYINDNGTDYTAVLGAGGAFANGGVVSSGSIGNVSSLKMDAVSRQTKASFSIDASRSSTVYGRAPEVRPNAAVGIWIIRASGAFTAASTNFSVLNGDTTLPANGVVAYGGAVKSNYRVAGSDYAVAQFQAKVTVGGAIVPELSIVDSSSGTAVTKTWTMPAASGTLMNAGDYGVGTDLSFKTGQQKKLSELGVSDPTGYYWSSNDTSMGDAASNGTFVTNLMQRGGRPCALSMNYLTLSSWLGYYTATGWRWYENLQGGDYGIGTLAVPTPADEKSRFIADSDGASTWAPANGMGFQSTYASQRCGQMWISNTGGLYGRFNTTGNAKASKTTAPWNQATMAGTSDINFKTITGDLDVEIALANVDSMDFKTFYYNDDEDETPRRGIIAQEAEKIDPEYVHNAEMTGKYSLDLNPLVLDALAAIKALKLRDEAKELRLSQVESELAELKELVASLTAAQRPAE